MMQSCASAAKLRSGGPILPVGTKAKGHAGIPPPRTVIGASSQADGRDRNCRGAFSVLHSLYRTQNNAVWYNALPHKPPQGDQKLARQGHDHGLSTFYGGEKPTELPFDLRHARAPITFRLSPDAGPDRKKKVFESLCAELLTAVRLIIDNLPDTTADIPPIVFEKPQFKEGDELTPEGDFEGQDIRNVFWCICRICICQGSTFNKSYAVDCSNQEDGSKHSLVRDIKRIKRRLFWNKQMGKNCLRDFGQYKATHVMRLCPIL